MKSEQTSGIGEIVDLSCLLDSDKFRIDDEFTWSLYRATHTHIYIYIKVCLLPDSKAVRIRVLVGKEGT